MNHWKSTVAGVLSGLLGTFTTIATFQVPMALMNPQQSRTWLYVTLGCNLATAIGRVWIGVLQNDAPDAVVVPVVK